MRFFESQFEFKVIGSVDIVSSNGIAPLATIGQSSSKIRLGKYIDAALHEASRQETLQKRNDDSRGLIGRSTARELC